MSNNVLATLKENAKQADETIALLKKHLAILEKETSKFSWWLVFRLFQKDQYIVSSYDMSCFLQVEVVTGLKHFMRWMTVTLQVTKTHKCCENTRQNKFKFF